MRSAKSPALSRRSRGISLAEVLIALAIAMIISAAMASLFAQSVKSREQVDRNGQRIESGRYALDTMADDIRLAGFYGDYLPRSSAANAWPAANSTAATWTAPGPCATTVANLGWVNSGTVNVPVAIFGYEGGHGVPSALPASFAACLQNYKSGTDVIVTRRVSTMTPSAAAGSTAPLTTATMTAGDVYLQASNCSTQSPRFVVSATATDFSMQNLGCSAASLAPLRKIVVRIYYVASCNTCLPSDGIPTLKVAELVVPSGSGDSAYHSATNDWDTGRNGTLSITIRTLTPGVEDMHFEYGVDSSADAAAGSGSADSYLPSNSAPTATSPFGWQNVMSVKTWLLARDFEQTAGYVNSKTYVMGASTINAFNDAYRRNVFASTIRVVNPAGAREIP